jgi:hypothetical protein
MSVPLTLGITFTQAELDAMQAGVQVVIDTIAAKISFNLSNEERQQLSKVGDERFPFVERSINDYGINYPQFNPLAYTYANVQKDGSVYGQMSSLLSKIKEADEVTQELQMVAGHFCFLFMRKQYELAQSNIDQNVPGAQVVYDGLKECFERDSNPVPNVP